MSERRERVVWLIAGIFFGIGMHKAAMDFDRQFAEKPPALQNPHAKAVAEDPAKLTWGRCPPTIERK